MALLEDPETEKAVSQVHARTACEEGEGGATREHPGSVSGRARAPQQEAELPQPGQ